MISQRALQISASATMALNTIAQNMRREGKDVISFGIGQPDFPTPDNIKKAGVQALQDNKTGYTPAIGELELREAVAAKLKRENDLVYSPSQIAVGSGGKGILSQIFLALLDPGDEVIVLKPFWVSYTEQIVLAGGKPVLVECQPGDFALDLDDLAAKISSKTKIILLNSPNNPCGVVYSDEDVRAVLELAQKNDCYVLSDECYEHFCYEKDFVSPASFSADAYERTLVCNAVSKTYSMTGWRIGYVATADEEIVKAISRLQGHNQGNPCSISQAAAVEALHGPQESVAEMRSTFGQRRDRMLEWIEKIPGLDCQAPPGAFYCFPSFALDLPSVDLAREILEQVFVVVIPGSAFGMEGHIRLSYAVDDELIEKGMQRLYDWFAKKQ
jgi:aspartate aminotransferase